MILGKKVLAVVPARGGSKGLPRKNLREFLNVPLVARVGHIIQELEFFDRAIVSTDDQEIAENARSAGLDVPFFRPEDLSGDLVGDLDILTHALQEVERLDSVTYDVIVMLQPTSPMRKVSHVSDSVLKLIEGNWEAVWTVSETDSKYHPLKQLTMEGDELRLYNPEGSRIIARQQLECLYYRNGAAYAFTRKCLLEDRNIMPGRCSAVIIEDPLISIDTEFDIQLAEWLMRAREQGGP